jgi:hypothetical protein
MNRYFDLAEASEKNRQGFVDPAEKMDTHVSKYLNKHFEKVSNLEKDLTRLPMPGEVFLLQSEGAFNAFTFVLLICKCFPIKELSASTYSINRKVIDALVELHDSGKIEKITLLVNDGITSRNPVTMDNLMAMAATRPNFTVKLAWVHAKVCLLETHHAHFVVEGSGNWSDNAQYEQYAWFNCKETYDFRNKLFTETKYKNL